MPRLRKPPSYGAWKDRNLDSKVDMLWLKWQNKANVEICANFDAPLDHPMGGAFPIKQGTLSEALAPRHSQRASAFTEHKWAMRRVQEARADRHKVNNKILSPKSLTRVMDHLNKDNKRKLLPQDIGIAEDLQRNWQQACQLVEVPLDAWHLMLKEHIRALENHQGGRH